MQEEAYQDRDLLSHYKQPRNQSLTEVKKPTNRSRLIAKGPKQKSIVSCHQTSEANREPLHFLRYPSSSLSFRSSVLIISLLLLVARISMTTLSIVSTPASSISLSMTYLGVGSPADLRTGSPTGFCFYFLKKTIYRYRHYDHLYKD